MKRLLICLSALLPLCVSAGGLDQLHQFLNATRTAKASFSQRVISKSGKPGQFASGDMAFSRPGKFRWEYQKPYHQLIVGDGTKLWTYDLDLNQVVVKPMGQGLGATPAALLAGGSALEKNFELKDSGSADGLEWVDAKPRSKESGFEFMRIGLKGGVPQAMEVRDNFGQITLLQFGSFERNPSLSAETFRFTPPKGADVVGE